MNNKRPRVLVALGTNAPHDRLSGADLLGAALDAIEAAGVTVIGVSSAWRTAPQPPSDQPDFINAVVALDPGERSPQELYTTLADIERAFGRERRVRWARRTLDLDIIDFEDRVGDFGGVELPHPRAHQRIFVLAPLAEVAPGWRHPVSGASVEELLGAVSGQDARREGPLPRIAKRPGAD